MLPRYLRVITLARLFMFASWRQRGAPLAKLRQLVQPPEESVLVGNKMEWLRVEKEMGTALPPDYKAFIDAYGAGQLGGFFWVYNPFSKHDRTNLLIRARELCERYQKDDKEDGRRYPYPAYPKQPGLLP